MTYASNKKSLEAGLTISPLAKTTWDIKEWWYSDAVEEERRKKFMEDENSIMNTETKLIAAWKEWQKDK